MRRWLIALVCCAMLMERAAAEDLPAFVGRQVDNFTLQDFRGKSHSLDGLQPYKLVVVAFLGTDCPLAKLYAPRLQDLHEEFEPQGVAFLGIDANRQDSVTEMADYAGRHEITFPLLKDVGNRVADALHAVRTPEVFILDAQRIVRYHGRIDDQYAVGSSRSQPHRADLKLALTELLAGRPVGVPETDAVGCVIGRIRQPRENGGITYSNQVAKLLQQHCVECHRPGQVAPFSLTSYHETAGWGETIAEVVRDRRMPPWHANPEHGKFENARLLSSAEKQLVYDWVADGMPEGDPKQAPAPRAFHDESQLPRDPDLEFYMSDEPFEVPAEGTIDYRYFTIDPKFTEDKWLQMAEITPGNPAVVHHVVLYVQPPGYKTNAREKNPGAQLANYVPGLRAKMLPKGMARRIPAGSKLMFEMHYTPVGSVQRDRSKVSLLFADLSTITHVVVTGRAIDSHLKIPPHADNFRVEAKSAKSHCDLQLLALSPHMHLRGKSFRFEAQYPGGETEILLDVPHYDFNWQTNYWLAEPKRMPAGTRILCTAHFDNSAGNRANPDPGKTVRWGDQSTSEMMIGFYDIAMPIEFDPFARIGESSRQPSLTPQQYVDLFLRNYDRNGDAAITPNELAGPFVSRLFDAADANRNGSLSRAELERFVEQLQKAQ